MACTPNLGDLVAQRVQMSLPVRGLDMAAGRPLPAAPAAASVCAPLSDSATRWPTARVMSMFCSRSAGPRTLCVGLVAGGGSNRGPTVRSTRAAASRLQRGPMVAAGKLRPRRHGAVLRANYGVRAAAWAAPGNCAAAAAAAPVPAACNTRTAGLGPASPHAASIPVAAADGRLQLPQ
eukprot:364813-Chlamydomonas_euryale.AAC.9